MTFVLHQTLELRPAAELHRSSCGYAAHLSRFFTSISCSMYHSPTIDLSVEPAFARPCKNFFPCHSLTRSLHAPFMVYSWCLVTVTELCRSRALSKYIPFCQNFALFFTSGQLSRAPSMSLPSPSHLPCNKLPEICPSGSKTV